MKAKGLTAERVRELLDYDPATGALAWRNPTPRDPSEAGKAGALGKAGAGRQQYRRFIQIDYKRYPAHRIVWLHAHGSWPKQYLLPKNDDYDDLRLDNLVEASRSEAARRGGPNRANTSGYRGITWVEERSRWVAYITHNYKHVHVGYFRTVDEAVAARDKALSDLGALPALDRVALEAKAAAVNKDARLRVQWRKLNNQTHGITGWQSFADFADDIGKPQSGAGMVLVPIDPEKVIGPGNFAWMRKETQWDHSTREGKRQYARFHREHNRNSYRDKEFRKNFGISLAEYQRMLAEQGGVCASCGNPETETLYGKLRWLAVDHCHNGGGVRGLLCGNCNRGIGCFSDDPERLRKAAAYLERHAEKLKSAARLRPSSVKHKAKEP